MAIFWYKNTRDSAFLNFEEPQPGTPTPNSYGFAMSTAQRVVTDEAAGEDQETNSDNFSRKHTREDENTGQS